ncbi:MAG: site-specific DNA-methyltransferase [Clostridia bacterium]|nr:site-specific DNA-methyltransferase [Clostridia bacterium]
MLTKTFVLKEHHPFGGSGKVFFADSAELVRRGLEEYAGKVQVIYLDPPSFSGGAFEFKDKYAFSDSVEDRSAEEYVESIKPVLTACRDLLCPSGSLYLHTDYRLSGKLRLIADEIFGEDNLMNEIIWSYKLGGRSTRFYSRKHDTILFYRRSRKVFFDISVTGTPRGNSGKNHMKRRADENGRIYFTVRTGGREYRYYEDDLVYPTDVWDDIEHLHQRDPERTGFSSQKPETLLKRVITASSREGDIVMDLFGGSGTTAKVAAETGRQFITADIGAASLFATRRRLIEAERETELFSEKAPFEVVYDDPKARQTLDKPLELVKLTPSLGGFKVAVLDVKNACAFAAVGRIEKGVFHADDYAVRPKEGEGMFLKNGGAIMLVDSKLRTGFFTLKDR